MRKAAAPEHSSTAEAAEKLLDPARLKTILTAGAAQAENAYRTDPTESNLRSYKAARDELSRVMGVETGDTGKAADGETWYALLEAVEYLRKVKGRRVQKTKLSADNRKGLIVRDSKTGRFSRAALDTYAKKHSLPLSGFAVEETDDHWARRKRKAEALDAEEKAKKRTLEVAKMEGRLIESSRVWQAWALSAQVLKGGIENWAHEVADRLIVLVDGNDDKIGEVITFMVEETERFFDQYADKRQFRVVVTPSEEAEWD